MLIHFCLPVHNEEKIIKQNIAELYSYLIVQQFAFSWQIIIINNGSTDSTEQISRQLENEKIKLINIKLPGKGRAIKTYGQDCQADVLAYMDIDLAVSLDNIPSLVQPLIQGKADLVIGSRLLPESATERQLLRTLSSKSYNLLSRLILKHNLSDLQCGFKAIDTAKFKQIIPYIENNAWFFDTELIAFAKKANLKTKEIPVAWKENRYQARKSKISLIKDSFKFFINLIKLKQRLNKIKYSSKV